MAKMIPSSIDPETKSAAERKVFYALRDMPDTDNWTAIHSIQIANHPTQSQGEADFVVIIPKMGLFVLEIKGGSISFSNGEWYSTNRNCDTFLIKNPIKEANDSMHAIEHHLKFYAKHGEDFYKTVFGFAVVFPDTEIKDSLSIPDLAKEQIADLNDNNSYNFKLFLERLACFSRRKLPKAILPTEQQCSNILQLLRPEFQSHISLKTIIKGMDDNIINLTNMQLQTFEGLSENDRCLVKGYAGTGKTVLAINYTLQAAERGKRIGFFCYNKLLADSIKKSISGYNNVICGSFTEYADDIVQRYYPHKAREKDHDRECYYKSLLPEFFAEAVLEEKVEPIDILVLDEAQDLMLDKYLDAFDCFLIDGLKEGTWCFFMDAEKQNMFNPSIAGDADVSRLLKSRKLWYANYTLTSNCRNSIEIINKIDDWFGTDTKSFLNADDKYEVKIWSYKKQIKEAEALRDLLVKLNKEGVSNSDIVILSSNRFCSSCVQFVTDFHISDEKNLSTDSISYYSIQSFKGLESNVVILVDIENVYKPSYLNLLYVGATRAKVMLFVFASEHAYKELTSGGRLGYGS